MKLLNLLPLATLSLSSPLVFSPSIHPPSTRLSDLVGLASASSDLTLSELEHLVNVRDPLALYKLLVSPEEAAAQDEPRLLQVFGKTEAVWATEGDKITLRAAGLGFADLTGSEDVSAKEIQAGWKDECACFAPASSCLI